MYTVYAQIMEWRKEPLPMQNVLLIRAKLIFLVRISVYILCFHNLLDITKVTLPLLRKDIVNSSIRMDECNIFNFLHV